MKESETVEFKRTTSELKEAIISIVGILNKHGSGELYFGIKDNGEIQGQDVSDKTLRDVSKTISDNIEPKIFPKVEKIIIEDKSCIKVDFSGKEIPYYAHGRAYIRVGTENRQLSAKEIENIIVHKNKENLRWDNQVCEKISLKEIDKEKISAYMKKANLEHASVKDLLERLEVLSNKGILNAGVLLFSKNPSKFFRSAKLRCAVFQKEDSAEILDRKEFEDDILSLIQKAQEYILEHINIGMRVEGLYRIDIPEINTEALREAIINAFCHRNYREYESVEITIFKDRIEIRNPGGVFGDVSLNEILKGKAPVERRNPLIADLFKRIHFGEKWGRGIKFILSKEPSVRFESSPNRFVTIFTRKSSKKTTQKTTQKIIELIKEKSAITREELALAIGITPDGIKYNLQKLIKEGKIKRIGPDKGGHWEIRK